MRKLLVILFVTITLPAFAQSARKPRVITKPEAAAPTPAPKKTLFGRVFGSPQPTPAPTPAPKATPVPAKPRPKITKSKPRTTTPPAPKPAETETPVENPAANTPPPPDATPVQPDGSQPPTPPTTPTAAVPPAVAKGTKTKGSKPEKPDLSNLDEPGKYQAIKELAVKDPAIAELRTKADSTIDEAEAKKASLAYNRALFQKVRALEPSLDAYVDRLEQAVLKRVK